MKKTLLKVLSVGALAIAMLVTCWSCQKEDNPTSDEELAALIARSQEMEDYIVAGYELEKIMQEWEEAMANIDFDNPDYIDENGYHVIKLPVSQEDIQKKLDKFNECKSALQKKYPQVISMSSEQCYSIIEACMKNSETIGDKLLAMGINVFMASKVIVEDLILPFDQQFLSEYVSNPNNVEAMWLQFEDGHQIIYINGNNTTDSCYLPYSVSNGNAYFPGYPNSRLTTIIHTHNGDMLPSPSEIDQQGKLPGVNNVDYGIYWKDNVYYY